MIKTFKSKEAGKIFYRIMSSKLPSEIQKVALRKLDMINGAGSIKDLLIPLSNNLEKLKADRKGQYSIRVNDKWRICFHWVRNNAYSVEIVDYH